jgi:hypothetical protein
VLAQSQTVYSRALRKGKADNFFEGSSLRFCRFVPEPVNGGYQFGISPVRILGSRLGSLDFYFDATMKFQRTDYHDPKGDEQRLFTQVLYLEPTWNYSNSAQRIVRAYDHALPADGPVYASLEKLRRAAGPKTPDHQFLLSAPPPGTALVIERRQLLGGSLRVFKL